MDVDALPRAGDWDEDSATWDGDSNRMRGSFGAGAFAVRPEQRARHRHEVDVTDAVNDLLSSSRDSRFATFMLSTRDSGGVDFASREWDWGAAEPQLVILLSDLVRGPIEMGIVFTL